MADNGQVEAGRGGAVHLTGVQADPAGVQELILRGMSIEEMVEVSGLTFTAILKAAATLDFAQLRDMLHAEVISREFHMERVRMAAMERLAELATNLSREYPDGMTADQARMIDVQRRAIISALRLPPFPTLRDSYRDVQAPVSRSGGSSRESDRRADEPAWHEFNRSVKDEVSDVVEAAETKSVEEAMAAFARAAGIGSTMHDSEVSRDPGPADPVEGSQKDTRPVADNVHGRGQVELVQSSVSSNGHIAATEKIGSTCATPVEVNGAAMPDGMNRASRRRWQREQRRNGHGRHPP